MITIEQVIEFFEQDYYTGDNWEFVNNKEAAAVVRAQQEEIERLRAANKDALAWFEDLKVEFDKARRERAEAYERAEQICEALDEHSITLPQAIRALKSGEPK